MTRILRSLVFVLAALVAVAAPSFAQVSTDSQVKGLVNLGLAHPTTGKLLAGSLIDSTSVVGASVQSTDNLLNTVTLDSQILNRVGRGVMISAWGTTAANINAKTIKLIVGSTAIATLSGSTASAKDFQIFAFLVTDASNSQRGFAWVVVDGAMVAASSINFTATETATSTLAVKTTGNNTAAAASAATGKGLVVVPIG